MNKFLKYYLALGLGILQFILASQRPIDWLSLILLMVLILSFQLLWFYARRRWERLSLVLLGQVTLYVLLVYLGNLPVLLLGLTLWQILVLLNFKQLIFYNSLNFLLLLGLSIIFEINQVQSGLLTVLFISILLPLIQPLVEEYKVLSLTQYETVKQEAQWQADRASMEDHIRLMRELYTTQERNRISRDIHDSVGHVLTTVIVQLGAMAKILETSAPQVSAMAQELRAFTQAGMNDVRQIVHDLKPSNYEAYAFTAKIDELIQDYQKINQISVIINRNKTLWSLTDQMEEVIYRAVQEFLANSNKHSNADEIRLNEHYTNLEYILTMKDNGQGADVIVPHMGLMGLEERIHSLGGKVTFKTALGQGFQTRIVLRRRS